jgi:hypothetical protein
MNSAQGFQFIAMDSANDFSSLRRRDEGLFFLVSAEVN